MVIQTKALIPSLIFIHFFSVSEALLALIGPGKALSGHMISSWTADDVIQCMRLCLITEQCKSFNFSSELLKCEMSDSKAETQNLDDREGFNYYEALSYRAISITPSE